VSEGGSAGVSERVSERASVETDIYALTRIRSN